MTRRKAIRQLALMAFGMVLGSFKVVHGSTGGQLTVALDQWQTVVFERKGKRIEVSVDEIFAAVRGGA